MTNGFCFLFVSVRTFRKLWFVYLEIYYLHLFTALLFILVHILIHSANLKSMFATGVAMGLTEWTIDDTCLVYTAFAIADVFYIWHEDVCMSLHPLLTSFEISIDHLSSCDYFLEYRNKSCVSKCYWCNSNEINCLAHNLVGSNLDPTNME